MKAFWFRLPQTLIRAFGIHQIENYNFFQYPILEDNRHWPGFAESNYKVNRILSETLGKRVDLIGNIQENVSELIVDYNLLWNLESNFFENNRDKIKSFAIMDYAVGDHSPFLSDLFRSHVPFLKATRNSFFLWKKFKPNIFYDWTGSFFPETRYFPWYWQNIKIDVPLFNSRAVKALQEFSLYSKNILDFLESEKPLLVQTNLGTSLEEIRTNIEITLSLNDVQFDTIFIKPHRSVGHKIGLHGSIRNIKVVSFDSALEKCLPAEILIFGNSKSQLLSPISSTIFSTPSERLFRWDNKNVDMSGYWFAHNRRKAIDKNYPWRQIN